MNMKLESFREELSELLWDLRVELANSINTQFYKTIEAENLVQGAINGDLEGRCKCEDEHVLGCPFDRMSVQEIIGYSLEVLYKLERGPGCDLNTSPRTIGPQRRVALQLLDRIDRMISLVRIQGVLDYLCDCD